LALGNKQAGFTLIELLTVITITSILSLALLGASFNYFVLITRNNASIDMNASSQNLLRTTVENLRYGDGVRQTNTITDPNAPSGGWNTSNTIFVIIIATPALDSSHNYIIDSSTSSPYMNELVYYKSGGSLMQRTLANSNAAGNTLKTSCPANLASPACPADKDLADFVTAMTFTLYDQDAALTTNPSLARSIKIDLTMNRQVLGKPISLNNSIRVTLRNRF
jgi:prepilin-type N-terminal cleavage/methylation domain-containing protein